MDPIDQRARTARAAVENATSEIAPASFTPRRSLVAPAVMAAGLLIGGSVLATSVLGDSNNAEQQVVTESDLASVPDSDSDSASDADSSVTQTPAPAFEESTSAVDQPDDAQSSPFAEGELFVLDAPPPELGEPVIFSIPEMDGVGAPIASFDLRVTVYGTPDADDVFIDGDIGIMRAMGMSDGVDGEPITVAGREVLVDRSGAPDGPSTIVNWVSDEGEAIGVATWRLELDALLPTVELLLEDPSAEPSEIAGLRVVGSTDSLSGGMGMMSAGARTQVMYQTDPTTVTNPDEFQMLVVSAIDADDRDEFSTAWLFSGQAPLVESFDDGVTMLTLPSGLGPDGSNPAAQATTVYVPHPTDATQLIAVADLAGGSIESADLLAAARSVRPATTAEAAEMGQAAEELMAVEAEGMAMVEGVSDDGARIVVLSGPEGFCIERDGVPAPEGCYQFVPPAGVDPEEPVSVLSARSAAGDVLLLPFGDVDSRDPATVRVELGFADGTSVTAEELALDDGSVAIPPGVGFGWTATLDQMPIAAVAISADGSEVSYVLPDIELDPGRTVTIVGMS